MIDDFCQVGSGLTFGAEEVACGKMGPVAVLLFLLGEECALGSFSGSRSSKDEYDLEFWVWHWLWLWLLLLVRSCSCSSGSGGSTFATVTVASSEVFGFFAPKIEGVSSSR